MRGQYRVNWWGMTAKGLRQMVVAVGLLLASHWATAEVWSVSTLGNYLHGVPVIFCKDNPQLHNCTLRDALALAGEGDQIVFEDRLCGTIGLDKTLEIERGVTITGPGKDCLTVSGENRVRVISVRDTAGTVSLENMTIANGASHGTGGTNGKGAGIFNQGRLVLSNVVLKNNNADDGSGIFNAKSGNLTLNASALVGNRAANLGGAIFNDGTVSVTRNTFKGNRDVKNHGDIYSSGKISMAQNVMEDSPRIVSFFMSAKGVCPAGWEEATYARGRMILQASDGNQGRAMGQPFEPAHPWKHHHGYVLGLQSDKLYKNAEWTTDQTRQVRLVTYPQRMAGKPDSGLDPNDIFGSTSDEELGYPYFQAVLCEQQEQGEEGQRLIDALPVDSVMYFNGPVCPGSVDPDLEWANYDEGAGRFIVPLVEKGAHGRKVGTPWTAKVISAGTFFNHDHGTSLDISSTLMGIDGATTTSKVNCDFGHQTGTFWDPAGYAFSSCYWRSKATSKITLKMYPENESTTFPFYTLLACRKEGMRATQTPVLPKNFTFFRATADCAKYVTVPATMGRFLVPLPENALPNQAFGTPLADGEARSHTHRPIQYRFNISGSYPISTVGDKAGGGFLFREQSWEVTPAAVAPNVPYIQLSHCMREMSELAEQPPGR